MATIQYPVELEKDLKEVMDYLGEASRLTHGRDDRLAIVIGCASSFARSVQSDFPLAEMWSLMERIAADRDNPACEEAWALVRRPYEAKTHDLGDLSQPEIDKAIAEAREYGWKIRESAEIPA